MRPSSGLRVFLVGASSTTDSINRLNCPRVSLMTVYITPGCHQLARHRRFHISTHRSTSSRSGRHPSSHRAAFRPSAHIVEHREQQPFFVYVSGSLWSRISMPQCMHSNGIGSGAPIGLITANPDGCSRISLPPEIGFQSLISHARKPVLIHRHFDDVIDRILQPVDVRHNDDVLEPLAKSPQQP